MTRNHLTRETAGDERIPDPQPLYDSPFYKASEILVEKTTFVTAAIAGSAELFLCFCA
jgi:hypothetical protein